MDLKEAVQTIYQGNSILLLGAGFSTSSKNQARQNLPTGGQLAKILANDLSISDKYPLSIIASQYIDKRGDDDLSRRLFEIFTIESVSPDQERISLMPWRRIYTLNYDNALEFIYKSKDRDYKSIDYTDKVRPPDGPTQIVHLHGKMNNGSSSAKSLILNTESYNSLSSRTGWFSRFMNDVDIADCVISIGCGMSDLHISSLFYQDSILQGKTFFIDDENIDSVWKDNLSKFGYVESIGIKKFADIISTTPKPPNTRRLAPISFDVYSPPSNNLSPSGSDIFDLVLLGTTKPNLTPDIYIDSQFKYILWRDDAQSIVNDMDSQHPHRRYIIHSDLGNGKTLMLEELKFALHSRGNTVITIKQLREGISMDIPYLSSLPRNTIIVVEDIFRSNNRSDLTTMINQFPHFSYIGTCRTSIFDLQGHEIGSIYGNSYNDYDINTLSDRECSQISNWFDANGLWGSEAGAKQEEKIGILTRRCSREFRSIILDRFKSNFIKEKISDVFLSIPEGDVKNWLLIVLILSICGTEPNSRLVHSLAGYSPSRKDVNNSGPIREFIDPEGSTVSIRSPVLSELLVSEMFSTTSKLNALAQIAKSCDVISNGRDTYSELIKFTYRPAILIALFPPREYLKATKELFDKLKSISSLNSKSLFWLQYAIILTNEREYHSAKVIFDTAFGKAKNSDFDTFQVDNHYARFLLESRMHAPQHFQDPFHAFMEAHKRIRTQILRDKYASHPYRVAEIYVEFLTARWNDFDSKQRSILKRIAAEMLEFSINAKLRHRAQKLEKTRDDLQRFISEASA